jgi:hypothetical protein
MLTFPSSRSVVALDYEMVIDHCRFCHHYWIQFHS